jgi:hypothetical protein
MTYPLYLMQRNVGDRVIDKMTGVGISRPTAVAAALLEAFIVSAFTEPKIRAKFKAWMGVPTRRLSTKLR